MRLVSLAIVGGALLTACAADEFVARDYVVQDLGGSNQTLRGAAGTISVDSVTAYRLQEPFIFVEADGRYDKARASWEPCSYHMIDMQSQRLSSPRTGSARYRDYEAQIANGGKAIMERSCAAKTAGGANFWTGEIGSGS